MTSGLSLARRALRLALEDVPVASTARLLAQHSDPDSLRMASAFLAWTRFDVANHVQVSALFAVDDALRAVEPAGQAAGAGWNRRGRLRRPRMAGVGLY